MEVMSGKEIFSIKTLKWIFESDKQIKSRPMRREGTRIEFKLSFNKGTIPDYLRTFAAFANTKGGFFVFGISNNPRNFEGLKNLNFEELDPAYITEKLNEFYSPEISWEATTHNFMGMKFGLFYIHESNYKPIISRRTSGNNVREGDIFYRYIGRTERIKFPELSNLINALKEGEKNLWVDLIQNIARIGVANTAVLDIDTGIGTSPSNQFLIDEKMLPNLNFIKDYPKDKEKNSPIVKIIGEAKILTRNSGLKEKEVIVSKPVHEYEIILSFLEIKNITNPLDYIKQLAYEPSYNTPIYFLIQKSELSLEKIITEISNTPSRSKIKDMLVSMLRNKKSFFEPIPNSETYASENKNFYRNCLIEEDEFKIPEGFLELRHFLMGVRSLTANDVQKEYVFKIMKKIIESWYQKRDGNIMTEIRKTICHLDILFYREND